MSQLPGKVNVYGEKSKLTLAATAQRIIDGTDPQIAMKEHIDEWNRTFDPGLYADEPSLTGTPHNDAWLAAAAEYEASVIGQACPTWANEPCRFLAEPIYFGGPRSRQLLANETPSEFARRGLFSGATWICSPASEQR